MKNFTSFIRYGNSSDKSVQMYRDFIIQNISSVLENTFPYFSSYLSLDLKDQIIKIFLEQNSSFDPAFHQIATELLVCSKSVKMSEQLSKLMEFEWLLYAIEISESKISQSSKINKDIKFSNIKEININPTLELISLPFDANNLDYNIDAKEEQSYIVYRDLDHHTHYQNISPIEFAMISSILERGIEVFELTDFKNLDDRYKKYLIKQLVVWNNQNIINLSI
ncbi:MULTISPECIES: HvfC/BufC family peptide modification chaperone [unclassified Francisella]|uniref:HvfC/BufC family peptide modification chaperone n=1 Tax=unclassified Francisella TaxID=2610885 RepID=UPI002E2F3617|nr:MULTISPECIES: putative DNA-binding domain-containing protein [unclassified Francisella]MED7818629.1 putative DNA-binding domain-containing protein [Francisella sp. 19S2-4]MED7829465.1 putative DNA-binding domain-containing protein [Francisella sp. 19S2-10]